MAEIRWSLLSNKINYLTWFNNHRLLLNQTRNAHCYSRWPFQHRIKKDNSSALWHWDPDFMFMWVCVYTLFTVTEHYGPSLSPALGPVVPTLHYNVAPLCDSRKQAKKRGLTNNTAVSESSVTSLQYMRNEQHLAKASVYSPCYMVDVLSRFSVVFLLLWISW